MKTCTHYIRIQKSSIDQDLTDLQGNINSGVFSIFTKCAHFKMIWAILSRLLQTSFAKILKRYKNHTRSLAVAKRPCDCCVGQFWPKIS